MLEEPPTVAEMDPMRQERNQSTTESGMAAEYIENAGHSCSGKRSRPKGYTRGTGGNGRSIERGGKKGASSQTECLYGHA